MVRRSSLRWVIDQMADEEVQQIKQAVLKTLADGQTIVRITTEGPIAPDGLQFRISCQSTRQRKEGESEPGYLGRQSPACGLARSARR